MAKNIIIYSLFIFLLAGCSHNMRRVKAELADSPVPVNNNRTVLKVESDYLTAAIKLYNNQLYDSALTIINNEYQINSKDWRVNYYLGLIQTRKNNFTESESYLFKSLKFAQNESKTRADIYVALGENYEFQGKLGKAKQHYHTALNLDPQSQTASEALKRVNAYSQYNQ